jgi:3-deoxy-D-manno-octulosonic-acid transferase
VTWLFYNLLVVVLSPLWVPWMIYRARRRKDKPNWRERTGEYDIAGAPERKRIWIHAVSVGEVIAARPILQELKHTMHDYQIVLSVTTSTGHAVAKPLLGNLIDYLFYFPIDVPRFCMSAMTRVEPCVVAIMETEFWFNFIVSAKAVRSKTCIVNGRVSPKSYQRKKWIKFYYASLFRNIDVCLMQTKEDAERIASLGAKHIEVLGNSKYDEVSLESHRTPWREMMKMDKETYFIVVGSMRGETEEIFMLEALKDLEARILIAPRHIERTKSFVEAARNKGIDIGLRSQEEFNCQWVVLDTFGELASAYSEADVAVVGGSFVPMGGQNLIQPMAVGCPVVCGPYMDNFRQPFQEGVEVGAVRVAKTPESLRQILSDLKDNPEARHKMGEAGKKLVAKNVGAGKRYAMSITKLAQEFQAERIKHNSRNG